MKVQVINNVDPKFSKLIFDKIKKKCEIFNIFKSRKLLINKIKNCDILVSGGKFIIDSEILDNAKKLKLILSPSTGTDHLDLNLIKKKKIKVLHIAKNYKLIKNFTATSELSFALLLSLTRNLIPASQDASKGSWSREKFTGIQLKNKTLGILGLGRLGKISAKIGQGFGMKIIAHDLIKKKKLKGVKMVSYNYLFKNSDFVFIHVHLSKLTENLINMKTFKLMKKNAFIINTSRGKIVNEKDLIKALKKKYISGAGTDVIDGEWLSEKSKKNHSLIRYSNKYNNLIITPHIGGATYESIKLARDYIYNYLLNYLNKMKS